MIAYFNGEFLPKDQVRISPDDRGFLFGDGVYEAIRAWHGRLFAADAHFRRLARSLRELRIAEPNLAQLEAAVVTLIRHNSLDDGHAAIYIQITRGVTPRRHAFPAGDVMPTVYATVHAFTPPDALLANPPPRNTRCSSPFGSLSSR